MRVSSLIGKRGLVVFLAAASIALGLLSSAGADPDQDSRRLDRQVRIFERALDDMLIESPNWLVRDRESTQGSYLEGRGVLFTFRADLNTWSWGAGGHRWGYHYGDDRVVIVIDDDDVDEIEEFADLQKELTKDVLPRQEQLYAQGKEELVETILEFGEILSGLGSEDWIEVKIRLRGAKFFKENDLRKLTVKVKMGDVRSYADGSLDESDVMKRIQIEES